MRQYLNALCEEWEAEQRVITSLGLKMEVRLRYREFIWNQEDVSAYLRERFITFQMREGYVCVPSNTSNKYLRYVFIEPCAHSWCRVRGLFA
jgi:hypothetical protein